MVTALRRSVLLILSLPTRLKRYYRTRHLHFITCSCYHRQPWLASAGGRDLFLRVLEQVRRRYPFVVVGYVAMPEHIHLLISEPKKSRPIEGDASVKARLCADECCESYASAGCQHNRNCSTREASMSGSIASMISMCGRRRSASRSCATCMAIRCSVESCANRSNGNGAAFEAMLTRNQARYELTSGTSDHHARSDGGMSPWSPPLQNPQRWASRVLSNSCRE
jgi:hypothetical protein